MGKMLENKKAYAITISGRATWGIELNPDYTTRIFYCEERDEWVIIEEHKNDYAL